MRFADRLRGMAAPWADVRAWPLDVSPHLAGFRRSFPHKGGVSPQLAAQCGVSPQAPLGCGKTPSVPQLGEIGITPRLPILTMKQAELH
jgi:hypothetical protein